MKIFIIVVWLNLNTNEYYHKVYRSYFFHDKGYINQYNHKIVDVITYQEILARHKFLKSLLRKLISFLENILKKI